MRPLTCDADEINRSPLGYSLTFFKQVRLGKVKTKKVHICEECLKKIDKYVFTKRLKILKELNKPIKRHMVVRY